MINLAVIGAGYWGSKIVESLKGHELVGKLQVVDIKEGMTINDIDADITAAIIATPLWDHLGTVLPLLERGFDCYVEKPMAETANDCEKIKQAITTQTVMVGHIFLYHPALDWIKENIERIGTIKHMDHQRLNWGIYQTKTTPLLSITTHDISIAQEILGSVKVAHVGHTKVTDTVQTDNIQLILENKDGVTANLVTSWYWPERVRKITIVGDQGSIVWDDSSNKIDLYQGYLDGRRLSALALVETHTPDLTKSPLQLELEHFIECIDQKKTPKTDIDNAIAVAKILDVAGEQLNLDVPHHYTSL